jgi:hypothetical protein
LLLGHITNTDHTIRLQRNTFRKDTIVEKGPLRRWTSQEIIEELNNLKISDGAEEFEEYGKEHNWTHKCGLWELPYSKALILMHNIDVMHQERNVAESIVMTCMNFPKKKNQKTIKSEKRLGYDLSPAISWTISHMLRSIWKQRKEKK